MLILLLLRVLLLIITISTTVTRLITTTTTMATTNIIISTTTTTTTVIATTTTTTTTTDTVSYTLITSHPLSLSLCMCVCARAPPRACMYPCAGIGVRMIMITTTDALLLMTQSYLRINVCHWPIIRSDKDVFDNGRMDNCSIIS